MFHNEELGKYPEGGIDDVEVSFYEKSVSLDLFFDDLKERFPEFSDVRVEFYPPVDSFDFGGFYNFTEGDNGEIIPTVICSLADDNIVLHMMDFLGESVRLISGMLGVESEEMTPQLLRKFIFVHELGHVKDFIVNFKNDPELEGWEAVDEMWYQREAVLTMLPVGGIAPSELARKLIGVSSLDIALDMFPEVVEFVESNGIESIDGLLAAQERAYRLSAPERYADNFAASVLREKLVVS